MIWADREAERAYYAANPGKPLPKNERMRSKILQKYWPNCKKYLVEKKAADKYAALSRKEKAQLCRGMVRVVFADGNPDFRVAIVNGYSQIRPDVVRVVGVDWFFNHMDLRGNAYKIQLVSPYDNPDFTVELRSGFWL
ncbi:MAG: hypothetical protein K6B46_03250 [Opitutales bacterium]|nr:hypothetical protein [Opitutales bacterium]